MLFFELPGDARWNEQRETVANFIQFLTTRPGTMPELLISPKSLVADESQFQNTIGSSEDQLEDPLLELLRSGQGLTRKQFLTELHRQRNPEAVATS